MNKHQQWRSTGGKLGMVAEQTGREFKTHYFNIFKPDTEKVRTSTDASGLRHKALMTDTAKDTEWMAPPSWEVGRMCLRGSLPLTSYQRK